MSRTNLVNKSRLPMQGTRLPSQALRLLPRQVCVPAVRTFSNWNYFNRVTGRSSSISTSPTTTLSTSPPLRNYTVSAARMGVEKQILSEGNGPSPKQGQTVVMEYTGFLFDQSKPNNRGDKFDSSVGRGDFETRIGVGQVIKGWDEGVVTMKQGEKAVLTISSDYAYGDRGFPGHIPPRATLIFEVTLKGIK